ncbi:peptide/nickel transport system permease protein [Rhizobiales bacterium GAS191]|nr:peptide/nickel transport system permease protein [Rhizobiales bacterium GAS191]
MIRLIVHRLLTSIPLVFVVTFLTFFLNSLAPGDLARTMLQGGGTEEQYLALRKQLGLDLPLLLQYWNWLKKAALGDLGVSFFTGERVTVLLNSRISVTVSLMIGVLFVCVLAGLVLGIVSALRGGLIGRAIDVLSMAGLIFPSFWVALVFIAVFAVWLQWFPATGYTPLRSDAKMWFLGMVLPVMSVALHSITNVAKQTRDSMLDVMGRDFIRSLRAVGISETSVVLKHALRNAALPVVTVLGLILVAAISGTVFVERVFVLPGLGSLAVQAAEQSDIVLLQGATLYFTLMTIGINLFVDLSYGWLNPKMRTR